MTGSGPKPRLCGPAGGGADRSGPQSRDWIWALSLSHLLPSPGEADGRNRVSRAQDAASAPRPTAISPQRRDFVTISYV